MDLENPRYLALVVVSASVVAGIVFGAIYYEIRAPTAPIQTPGSDRTEGLRP